ncbi:hypothetical protein GGX14DRAFT_575415 [Mycena pura]|uniref:Uncharacterized protein n=1 Tax=Mycena pura TaxID=153505 RepID=A0AAD6UV44_9AGAR|nr:hypothetical protein GGX14DRAFT_575415 [Mycena pura]
MPPMPSLDHENHCPSCYQYLPIKFAVSGRTAVVIESFPACLRPPPSAAQAARPQIRSQSEGPTLPHAWLGTHNIRLLVVTLEAPCWTTPLLVQEFSTTPNDSFLLLLRDNCVSHPPTPLQNLVFAIAGVWAPIDAALRVVWARGRIGARGMPQSWRLHGDGEGNRDGADKMERVQEGDVRGWREWALAMECRPTKCAQPSHGRKFPKTSGHGVRAPSSTLKDGQLLVWRVEHGTQSGTHYDSSIKYNEPKRVVIESFPACLRPPPSAAQAARPHYIACGPRCKYFHSFPRRNTPPTVPHDAPPANWRPPSSSAPARSTPSSSVSTASRTDHCQHNPCGRKAAPACVNHRCKTHCIVDNGGCVLPGHQQQRLTSRQQQKHRHVPASTPRSPPASSRLSPDTWLPGLSPIREDLYNRSFPTINLPIDPLEQRLRHDAAEEAARDRAQDAELRSLLDDLPPLTDEERANQEAADLALALAQSKHIFEAERLSRPASHATSLRPIYSVVLGCRVYAPEDDNTNVSFVDAPNRRFTLVFWSPGSDSPSIKCLQDLPRWPLWAMTDSPHLITRLGIEVDMLELYDTRIRLWKEIEISFTHKLTDSTYVRTLLDELADLLTLWIPGTPCPKLKELVDTLMAKPVHLRDNLPGDRHSIRQKMKVKQEAVDVIDISESPEKVLKKPKRKALDTIEVTDSDDDDDTFPSPISLLKVHSKRPKLTIDIPKAAAALDSMSSQSCTSQESSLWPHSRSSTPATTPFTPTAHSRSSTPSIHAPSAIDLSLKFPKGLTVKEVTDGFKRMVSPELQKLPMAQRFVIVYKRPWVKQTYLDAVARWERANETERQQALAAADDSPLGTWTTWARGFPLRK